LLAKGWNGLTAWVRAADKGNKEILGTVWGWGRQLQVNVKDNLLLAKDRFVLTAWEEQQTKAIKRF
jgi:hypothetical protein